MLLGAWVDFRGTGGEGEFFPFGEEWGAEGEEDQEEGIHGITEKGLTL
jgi:hypothetical protein